VDQLRDKLQLVLLNSRLVEDYRQKAMLRIKNRYGWESITDRYEKLFASMSNGKRFNQDFESKLVKCK
jgi:glycosyltransferase involved in cell wall biosynthesis